MAEHPQADTSNAHEFSVTELSTAIKRTLEGDFAYVRLRGEISGYRGPHASGHCYFGIKDDKAKIDAVIWRGVFGKLKFKPEEGLEVIATGKITTYPGSSKYQIVVQSLEPAGVGALMALLEERKKKLAAEGLFDEARKQPLPYLPAVVGIVTSPTGAVIRDMLHGFRERFPVHVIVWPVRVQGESSADEVATAVRGFNAMSPGGPIARPDILIVARGGGSLEDLWGFNEEVVVRAVADSKIPVISAVGHETDWTLIDLVADARAPTPTKAAEWAVPVHSELLETCAKFGERLAISIRRGLEVAGTRLLGLTRGLPRADEIVALPRQRFDAIERRLGDALLANTRLLAVRQTKVTARLHPRLLLSRLERADEQLQALGRQAALALRQTASRQRLRLQQSARQLRPQLLAVRMQRDRETLAAFSDRADRAFVNLASRHRRTFDAQATLLASLSYQSVLSRGFALVRTSEGQTVRAAASVAAGSRLHIEFADGRVAADVVPEGKPIARTPPGSGSSTGEQVRKSAGQRGQRRPPSVRKPGSGGQGSLF